MNHNDNNFNNMDGHDADLANFERLSFDSDMWNNEDLHTPIMNQPDQFNYQAPSNMMNVTPVNQTINQLDPSSSWYQPMESIVSSNNTSVDQSPHYITSTDKVPKTGVFHNNLMIPVNPHAVNISLDDTFHGAQMNEEPMPLTAVNIKQESPEVNVIDTYQPATDINAAHASDSAALCSGSSSPKTTPSTSPRRSTKGKTSPGSKKLRKKLTNDQKLAHNKIEKRYRININTKIAKLQQIIPWVASNDTAFEVSEHLTDSRCNSVSNGPVGKVNKSKILDKAVDYIIYLQNKEQVNDLEILRLKEQNAKLMDALANGPNGNNANDDPDYSI